MIDKPFISLNTNKIKISRDDLWHILTDWENNKMEKNALDKEKFIVYIFRSFKE